MRSTPAPPSTIPSGSAIHRSRPSPARSWATWSRRTPARHAPSFGVQPRIRAHRPCLGAHGFFGHEHEKNDREWDSNGQALWAFGRFDRIRGPGEAFGAGMFAPYVIDGARWIRDNRAVRPCIAAGAPNTSVTRISRTTGTISGPRGALRGCAAAGAPSRSAGAGALGHLRRAEARHHRFHSLGARRAAPSWSLGDLHSHGAGRRRATRFDDRRSARLFFIRPGLHQGPKLDRGRRLGHAPDPRDHLLAFRRRRLPARFSLELLAAPYLTLQLAHCFLYVGDVARMDALLAVVGRQRGLRAAQSRGGQRRALGTWCSVPGTSSTRTR